jgi:hypothetical protein
MRLHLVLSALLLYFCLVTPGLAQPPGLPDGKRASASAADEFFVIEQKHLRVVFEKDGRGRRALKMRVRILRDQGAQHWGQLPLPYSSETETLTIDRVQVEKADGTIMREAAGAVQDLAVNQDGDLRMFVDLRQKQVTVSSLRPGDVLEFLATWSIVKPIAPGHYWFEYSFTRDERVLDERLEIDLPREGDAILKVRPTAPPQESSATDLASRRIHRWITRNLTVPAPDAKPVPYEGDGSPADVRLTTYRSWNDVAMWYGELMTQAKATDSVKAKAIELTRGIDDPSAKVNAIFGFVAREVRYVSLSFGLGRYAPHAPAEVLKNLYGDCNDKVALLSAMLAAVGIESIPVLLHTDRSLDESLASPLELDHVITVLPLGEDPARWLWLDATVDIAPGGMLLQPIRGKRALLVGAGRHASRLMRTPADPPFPSVEFVELKGTVDPIGVLRADVRMTVRGDEEVLLRGFARALNTDGLKQMMTTMLKEVGLKGDISNPIVSDAADTREPFQVTVSVRESGYFDWTAAKGDVVVLPRLGIGGYTKERFRDEKFIASELALKAERLAETETVSLTVAGLEQKHLDMMEDVVWTWDALSIVAFEQSRWADAERYGRAAWLLGRDRDTAFRLGEVYEKLERRADAASFYLTAHSLYSDAPGDVRAAVKRFVGEGADIAKMVETARQHALEPRMLPFKAADGKGEYLALVGSDQRVLELKFVGGEEAMRQLAEPLKAAAVPLAFPSANATRIAVKLVVGCQAGRCGFIVAPANMAKIEFQGIK